MTADLAAGVGAAGPVDADFLWDVQLLLQLLHDRHRPVLRLNHCQPAELQHSICCCSAGSMVKPTGVIADVRKSYVTCWVETW